MDWFFGFVFLGGWGGGVDLVFGFGFVFLSERKNREVEISSKLTTHFGTLADGNKRVMGDIVKKVIFHICRIAMMEIK